jgi:membrane protein implicated in regulation of membrane protease activity
MTEDGMSVGGRTDERSLGELLATATTEMSALVHEEVALAKAELRADAKRAGVGGGAIGVAAVLGLVALPLWGFAAAYGIHNLGLGLAWSFLIVGGGFIVVALLLLLLAVRKFKRIKPPEKSLASAKETAAVLSRTKPHPRVRGKSGQRVAEDAAEDRTPEEAGAR